MVTRAYIRFGLFIIFCDKTSCLHYGRKGQSPFWDRSTSLTTSNVAEILPFTACECGHFFDRNDGIIPRIEINADTVAGF